MKIIDILGVILVVFDHKRGPYIALERKNSSKNDLLKNNEQSQLIESISAKKYIPNDFLHVIFKDSSKYAFGRVYECKTNVRSDLWFILLIMSNKASHFDSKILAIAISEAIAAMYPGGFIDITDGEKFITVFSNACQISKKNELILQNYTINLEQLKLLAPKYHLKDETVDILKNQFGN